MTGTGPPFDLARADLVVGLLLWVEYRSLLESSLPCLEMPLFIVAKSASKPREERDEFETASRGATCQQGIFRGPIAKALACRQEWEKRKILAIQ